MALETLKEITEIDGFEVRGISEYGETTRAEGAFVTVDHKENAIIFKIQNGPIKENGVNGCQVDTIIATAAAIIIGLNAKSPCRENALAITKLDEALHWLKARKQNRLERGVEGTNVA